MSALEYTFASIAALYVDTIKQVSADGSGEARSDTHKKMCMFVFPKTWNMINSKRAHVAVTTPVSTVRRMRLLMTRWVCSNLLRRTVNSCAALVTNLHAAVGRKRTYEIQHSDSDDDVSSSSATEPDDRPAIQNVQLCHIRESWNLETKHSVSLVFREIMGGMTHTNSYGERAGALHERYNEDQRRKDVPLADLVDPPGVETLHPGGNCHAATA